MTGDINSIDCLSLAGLYYEISGRPDPFRVGNSSTVTFLSKLIREKVDSNKDRAPLFVRERNPPTTPVDFLLGRPCQGVLDLYLQQSVN